VVQIGGAAERRRANYASAVKQTQYDSSTSRMRFCQVLYCDEATIVNEENGEEA